MNKDHKIWCVDTSDEKPAWYCIWVTLNHFRVHIGQFCEIYNINYVTMINPEEDELVFGF